MIYYMIHLFQHTFIRKLSIIHIIHQPLIRTPSFFKYLFQLFLPFFSFMNSLELIINNKTGKSSQTSSSTPPKPNHKSMPLLKRNNPANLHNMISKLLKNNQIHLIILKLLIIRIQIILYTRPQQPHILHIPILPQTKI